MPFVYQWKGILQYFHDHHIEVTLHTIKNWHYKVKRIPFRKTPGRKGRVFIESLDLLNWFKEISH